MTEQMVMCPKCKQMIQFTEAFEHHLTCKGAVAPSQVPIWQAPQSVVVDEPPIKIEQPKVIKEEVIKPEYCKKCGSQYIIGNEFKACIKCKTLKVRPKALWWLFLRYGLMLSALMLSVGFIWGIFSYHRIFG
jgi:hypothetical protein